MPQPLPIGVIEAKAETADPLQGMQQAKGYADCTRFAVRYVFATNGHRYGEFDKVQQLPGGPFPFPDFPTHDALTVRYAKDTGVDVTAPESAMLFMADSTAFNKSRYYQDAAIRAAFEKILRCEQAWDKLAKAFPKGSARIVETDYGDNAAKNAKVHIATYQTLGLDDEVADDASFLTHHYGWSMLRSCLILFPPADINTNHRHLLTYAALLYKLVS